MTILGLTWACIFFWKPKTFITLFNLNYILKKKNEASGFERDSNFLIMKLSSCMKNMSPDTRNRWNPITRFKIRHSFLTNGALQRHWGCHVSLNRSIFHYLLLKRVSDLTTRDSRIGSWLTSTSVQVDNIFGPARVHALPQSSRVEDPVIE